jgi:hypothetical protein
MVKIKKNWVYEVRTRQVERHAGAPASQQVTTSRIGGLAHGVRACIEYQGSVEIPDCKRVFDRKAGSSLIMRLTTARSSSRLSSSIMLRLVAWGDCLR